MDIQTRLEPEVRLKECPGSRPPLRPVNLDAFVGLHEDGRALIRGWFRRAEDALVLTPGESFEAFIFAWFAYNGWAACCSGIDSDAEQNQAMASSANLQDSFEDLIKGDSGFAAQAADFRHMWPFFKAQQLRRNLIRPEGTSRPEVVEAYFAAHPYVTRQPSCYDRHRTQSEAIPVDWPHTLVAIYQVRCNLFHGEKAAHSEMDRAIVDAALRTLIPFIGRYILA